MKNIELVIFDMAGTTVRDQKEVETCFAEACKITDLDVNEERILALQGYSKIEVFRMLWNEKIGESHAEFAKNVQYSYENFTRILEEHYENHTIFPTDHCLEIFEYLKSHNIKIALTTGFYRKITNIIFHKLGWLDGLNEDYFNASGKGIIDLSIASDEVEKGRPQPDMILKAVKTLGISDIKNVINIGDTPSDLQSGKSAGVSLSLGVCNGTHSRTQLEAYPNDGLLVDLSELKIILER
ncbi:HAD family hydrolase [Lacihabitans sp. CCS-44]|uniref:HAD hydrolase-like protein n=1 Tax=Lacihabitans sp. CCS-44 TaxID=2487331 RepID=UPI0020CE1068|nr:HAD hydrolase-like protein [Lacihabitans sp. CCS-44]MCP9757311.1 HAD family hydrolase [Lacihabitans sp. CCS-44]